tara:strand:+ start:454 stop:1077 length:624 start_codon:yes stop_codon:yes gene_type:complete
MNKKNENMSQEDKNQDLEKKENLNSNDTENNDKDQNPANNLDKDNDERILENEIENLKEERLRILAEMENLRKRYDKDKIDYIKYGSASLAKDFLSPNDNLSRALESLKNLENDLPESMQNLVDGLKMVKKEILSIFEKHGIQKIDAIEKKFDHNIHQAMLEVESDEHEPGIVVQEVQSGFMMHDRLLRPSMVGVSKKPENKKKDEK